MFENGTTRRSAFTLVELLVVIAIIGVLVALLLPAVQAAREAARRIQCANRIKQIALAMHSYHDANGSLPYGAAYVGSNPTGTATAFILPYIEQQAVYDTFDFRYLLSHDANKHAVTTAIPQITCPSDPLSVEPILSGRFADTLRNPVTAHGLWYAPSGGPVHDRWPGVRPCLYCDAVTSYGWYVGKAVYCCQGYCFGSGWAGQDMGDFPGMFGRCPIGVKFSDVTDGLSNTIMLGETLPGHSIFNSAYAQNLSLCMTHIPINNMVSDNGQDTTGPGGTAWWQHTMGFKSLHPGGANFAMGDGRVDFLVESIDYRLYNAVGTTSGGEVQDESKL